MHIERGKWYGKSQEEIARDWDARGFSCDVWVDPPGQRWEDFVHSVDELVTPLDAPIEVEWEGEVAQLEPGDEWFIPRRTRHSVRNTSGRTVRWLYGYKRGR
ncbi:MAG: cupin domain-containing protein [Blastocatellia bacterium]|nr:cupin domain-containing protein [Blastocatellia bacterium]MCS7157817.1 cupin domain-containing protein [Blastocatellia bacterium]MDW8168107.1 cupin domain-containing protein [Acidobacteriota bacterium]MDW8257645.1 cupin domain-containing protein [Acidobacteriota bacterium]